MEDEVVFRPDVIMTLLVMSNVCLIMGIIDSIFKHEFYMMSYFVLVLIIFWILFYPQLYTVSLNKEGCTIHHGKKREFFKWDDFAIIRYERLSNRAREYRLFFSVEPKIKPKWFYEIFNRHCFYISLIKDWDSYAKVSIGGKEYINPYPHDEMIYRMIEWNVPVSVMPEFDKIHYV